MRRVLFLGYDGFELLDLAGPAGVFTTANALSGAALYEVVLAAPRTTCRAGGGGVSMAAVPFARLRLRRSDTVLVLGSYEGPLRKVFGNEALGELLRRAGARCERVGSVCTGALLLAEAGLLHGLRATTHWAAAARARARYPHVHFEADALYVVDGTRWTSAGVTTGIDLALAMLKHDHGPSLATRVARQLVVYTHRPGHQSQFSAVLEAQRHADPQFALLLEWLAESLASAPTVADMATRMSLSPRSFLRKFKATVGTTPSKLLATLRIDRARTELAAGTPVKRVAAAVGFRSEAAFRTRFTAQLGVSPSHYAAMSATP